MTKPRSSLVSSDITRYYHCITRCVRQAFLLQEGKTDRKKWLQNRIREVAEVYAVSVANYAIMDNHFHLLLRLDVDVAASWTDREVITRWAKLHPPRKNRKPVNVTEEWVDEQILDTKNVEKLRKRLCNLGWFMKEVKEPLARLCNQEDNHKGTFFEGRFKSIGILDDQALLATAIYIELNPFAAGQVSTPEASSHTSLYERLQHVKQLGRLKDLSIDRTDATSAIQRSRGLEDNLWLIPIEDRRNYDGTREGLVECLPLVQYLLVLDAVAKRPREGKNSLSHDALGVIERLHFDETFWSQQRERDYSARLFGNFFASSRQALKNAAQQLGLHHCWNLTESRHREGAPV